MKNIKYISIIFLIIILILIFFLFNFFIKNNYEHFYFRNPPIVTWTPYFVDIYNQPGFTNYFYNNGYMYPVY